MKHERFSFSEGRGVKGLGAGCRVQRGLVDELLCCGLAVAQRWAALEEHEGEGGEYMIGGGVQVEDRYSPMYVD